VLLNKVLSAGLAAASQASGNTNGSNTPILPGNSTTPFSSPLHWRRAGIRYAQNEVYFDITEEVKAILDKWVDRHDFEDTANPVAPAEMVMSSLEISGDG
jgi:hypothetical protein